MEDFDPQLRFTIEPATFTLEWVGSWTCHTRPQPYLHIKTDDGEVRLRLDSDLVWWFGTLFGILERRP